MFGQDMQAKGKIRFTAPVMILSSILLNPIVGFRQQWPEIDIEFDHSLDVLNLNANEADIAMRMTNNPSDELIGRQVGHFCEAAYASKRYLSRHRKGVEHPWIYPGGRYQFDQPLNGKSSGQLKPMITLPDPETQLSAARQHLGVATIPCMMGGQCSDLVRISPVVKRSGIWLLSHRDTRGNRRMQLFRDFLIEQMTAHRDLLEGIT